MAHVGCGYGGNVSLTCGSRYSGLLNKNASVCSLNTKMKVLILLITTFATCVALSHAGSLRPHEKYHERLIQREKEQLKASGIEGEGANHLLMWASSKVMLPNVQQHGNEKEEVAKEEPKIEERKEVDLISKTPKDESKSEGKKTEVAALPKDEPKREEKKTPEADDTKASKDEPKREEKKTPEADNTKAQKDEPKREEKKTPEADNKKTQIIFVCKRLSASGGICQQEQCKVRRRCVFWSKELWCIYI